MRVRDLSGWPPDPGGAYKAHYEVPNSSEAMIDRVVSIHDKSITFVCKHKGTEHSYDYAASNESIALKLKEILEANIGKPLIAVSTAEIDE